MIQRELGSEGLGSRYEGGMISVVQRQVHEVRGHALRTAFVAAAVFFGYLEHPKSKGRRACVLFGRGGRVRKEEQEVILEIC